MNSLKSVLGVGIVSFAAFLSGCGGSSTTSDVDGNKGGDPSAAENTSPSESTLAGQIEIQGSSTVLPISNAVNESFSKLHPNVTVNVKGDGTGTGFEEFNKKKSDISDASRPIKSSEFAKCKEAGVEFVELPVAYDGLTIVVNPENDWVKSLTVDQLKKIFVGDDAAKTWKEIDESWPEEEIKIFAPGTGSGTYDYFHEVTAKKDKKELRGDMNLNEDDNVLVQGVAGNKNSIGFFGVAYYEENKDSLRAVPIVNPKDNEAYSPTQENIASNKYAPFSRPLFIYVNAESLNRAEVQAFVQFYIENVSELCEKVGYVRLPQDIMAMTQENLDNVVLGTHFVDAEGNGRSGAFSELFKAENLTK